MIGSKIGIAMGLGLHSSGGGAAITGAARPEFTTTPDFMYHPHSETGVALSGATITGVTGMAGSPDLAPLNVDGTSATGPDEITDSGTGLKWWRNRDSENLVTSTPGDFTATPREFTLLLVVRAHSTETRTNYFGFPYATFTDYSTYTAGPSNQVFAGTKGNQIPNYLECSATYANSTAAGDVYGIVGLEPTVVVIGGRTTANGGIRMNINGQVVTLGQGFNANANMPGFCIGDYFPSDDGRNNFDLACIAGFKGTLSNSEIDTIAAEAMAHFGISATTRQIVLEGDSILADFSVLDYQSVGFNLANSGVLPAGTRVINMAISGNQVSNLVTKRDFTNGWPGAVLPGGAANNVLAVQIGINDIQTAGRTPAQVAGDIEAYLNTTTTGVLQRGFSAAVGVNISVPTYQTEIDALRALLRASTFLDNTASNTGDAYEGLVDRVELALIEDGGGLPFDEPDFTAGAPLDYYGLYYDDPSIHPTVLGALTLATGGDTPANGFGSIF